MSDGAEDGAGQIETQIADITEFVVYVISEKIQKEHIPEQVHKTAMQKGIADKLPRLRPCGCEHESSENLLVGEWCNKGQRKDENVNRYKRVVRVRSPPRANAGADWQYKNHILLL